MLNYFSQTRELEGLKPSQRELEGLKPSKIININDTATLNETIINDTIPDINTKTINVNNSNEIDLDIESIELDKLLSGDIKYVKTINTENTQTETTIEYSLDNLNTMSIKQLKDVAKQYKVKTSGSKQELIQSIIKVINC